MKPYYEEPGIEIYCGDALETLSEMPDASVQCCITSPPYWGLRDYGVAGQLGLDANYLDYVAKITAVFAEVRRVLREDGTLWLNLGDSYATGAGKVGECPGGGVQGERWRCASPTDQDPKRSAPRGPMTQANRMPQPGLKPKDLVGIPWRVAFALQADGWYLRSDIIWHKPNPMPESVTDRPTKSHEYLFLLAKSERYYYDADAIKEPATGWHGSQFDTGKTGEHQLGRAQPAASRTNGKHNQSGPQDPGRRMVESVARARAEGAGHDSPFGETRNRRDVWTIATEPYPEAHFATFPPDLIIPCVKAGCPPDGVVLDPFMGSGTTLAVARQLGRRGVGIELNPDYCGLAEKRFSQSVLHLSEATA